MAKKYYAIKEGFDFSKNIKVENKIVDTWAECQKYIKGVKGAKYKSFTTEGEAKSFLFEGCGMLKKGVDNYPTECLHIYVDGSYNISTEKYSYALVAVKNNIIEHIESGSSASNSDRNIRQIAGELEAAVRGLEYAIEMKEERVVIFHDYEGIAHHATGFWNRNEESSVKYYNKMNDLMSRGIEVIFVKVDSHTGDLFNEVADEKCKEELSIVSENVVYSYLRDNTITVNSSETKIKLKALAKDRINNIIALDGKLDEGKENLSNEASDKVIIKEEVKEKIAVNEYEDILYKDLVFYLRKLPLEKQKDVLNYAEYLYNKENRIN
ncbi:reverse transcriptase-like protein [Clostridium tertium]|uniref:RNase H n=1 Tax=Clostridium tertium TaxID=1559 RepID=A0A6N3D950_9CLOT